MVWKAVGALERTEKQAWLCGFLSPCQDPAQLPLPLAAAAYGNLTAGGHFCNCSRAGQQGGRGGLLLLLLTSALASEEENEMHLQMSLQLFLALMGFLLSPVSAVVQCCSWSSSSGAHGRSWWARGSCRVSTTSVLCPRVFMHVCWWRMVSHMTRKIRFSASAWKTSSVRAPPCPTQPGPCEVLVPPPILRKRAVAASVTVVQNEACISSQCTVFCRTYYVRSALNTWPMLVITLWTGFLPLKFLFLQCVSSPDLCSTCNFVCTYCINWPKPGSVYKMLPSKGPSFVARKQRERALWASAIALLAGEGKICAGRERLLFWVNREDLP